MARVVITWGETPADNDTNVSEVHVTGLVENDQAAAAANTAAVQAAVDAAHDATAVRPPLTGGGNPQGAKIVRLPPGNFYISRSADPGAGYCLLLRNATVLRGAGWGTRLTLADAQGTTAAPCVMIMYAAYTNFVGLEDFALDGNKANQADTTDTGDGAGGAGASHGIWMERAGSQVEMFDGGFWLDHVLVWGCKGAGINAYGTANTATITGCWAYKNQGHGFALKTDQKVISCKAGQNGGSGFWVYASTSCLIANCKSFGNEGRADLDLSYSSQVIVDNFTSEDCKGLAGIYVGPVSASRITGGVHRYMNGGSYNAAVWVEDAGTGQTNPWSSHRPQTLDMQIVCHFVHDPTGATTWDQPVYYPHYLLATRNLGGGVSINIRSSGHNQETGGTPEYATWRTGRHWDLGGSSDADIRFNNSNTGTVSVAYAASVVPVADLGETHLIGELTGDIAINNPAHPYRGQRLGFQFVQDGTGGRAVTWGSAFKPGGWAVDAAPSARTVAGFVYDGLNWVPTS